MIVSKVYNWLQNSLYVEVHCLLCRGKTHWNTPVCGLCLDSCPVINQRCPRCGLALLDSNTVLCGRCLIQPPDFDTCLEGYLYEYPVNQIIQSIKYRSRLELLPPITQQLSSTLQDYYQDTPWPDAAIPVPLHNHRLRQRGYDQALLLAREIKKQAHHHLLLDTQSLVRTRATSPQQGLNAKARRKNLRSAFALTSELPGKHLALIDDVVTTGETVNEITRLLKKAGAERVDIWCLARTPAFN